LDKSNLHIDANGLYSFILSGLIISAFNTRFQRHFKLTGLSRIKFTACKRLALPAFSTLAVCLVISTFQFFNLGSLVGKSWASSNDATWIQVDGETYGAQADKHGPIGGGRGYTGILTTGDLVVENLDQLLAAIDKAEAGQIIFIPGQVEIDCTARVYIEQLVLKIPGGVTLASNRGHNGSKGALIYSDALKTTRVIRPMGPDVGITGLRIRGPNPKRYLDHHRRSFAEGPGREYYYSFPTSTGIWMEHPGLEVDNCEISGFSQDGIYLVKGNRHHVHHNFIHHCQYQGLGYGITNNYASSLIERNLFNFNRHSIAGTGRPGCSYEARHNIELGTCLGHCFDMHGSKDGTDIAGTMILIHHNTFRAPNTPIVIRGVPQDLCMVSHNWFLRHANPKKAVRAYEKTIVKNNVYGTSPVKGD
jgi:hypothetical protein